MTKIICYEIMYFFLKKEKYFLLYEANWFELI